MWLWLMKMPADSIVVDFEGGVGWGKRWLGLGESWQLGNSLTAAFWQFVYWWNCLDTWSWSYLALVCCTCIGSYSGNSTQPSGPLCLWQCFKICYIEYFGTQIPYTAPVTTRGFGCFFVIDDRSYLEMQTVFMCKRRKAEVHRMAPHPLLRMAH